MVPSNGASPQANAQMHDQDHDGGRQEAGRGNAWQEVLRGVRLRACLVLVSCTRGSLHKSVLPFLMMDRIDVGALAFRISLANDEARRRLKALDAYVSILRDSADGDAIRLMGDVLPADLLKGTPMVSPVLLRYVALTSCSPPVTLLPSCHITPRPVALFPRVVLSLNCHLVPELSSCP